MPSCIQPTDLSFFSTLASANSLSAAALELGITTPAVSKHLAQMEARVGLCLVNRTTRRMSLTSEGKIYLEYARRILGEIDDMEQVLVSSKDQPKGLLRINATLGFGRNYVAPLISRLVRKYPQLSIELQLSANPPSLTDDSFDVYVRFGAPPDARVIAKRIASNRRLLCAAPAYLAAHGIPETPEDLSQHNCIEIRQGVETYGIWRLSSVGDERAVPATVRIHGNLMTNHGEAAVSWALDGLGILMRSEWDIKNYLRDGSLIPILPRYYTPDADIYAVYPQRHQLAARVRTFVDFMAQALASWDAPGKP